ncbi:MAG: hypothetical protein ACI4MC_07220, partial [Candidatus Coproplasma sp.]
MKEKSVDKKKVKKALKIASITIFALFILFFIIGVIIEAAAPELPFSLWVKENMWDVSTLP